jgi:hypothetical protein
MYPDVVQETHTICRTAVTRTGLAVFEFATFHLLGLRTAQPSTYHDWLRRHHEEQIRIILIDAVSEAGARFDLPTTLTVALAVEELVNYADRALHASLFGRRFDTVGLTWWPTEHDPAACNLQRAVAERMTVLRTQLSELADIVVAGAKGGVT